MWPESYATRVETIAANAAIDVMNGHAADIRSALEDVDSPAIRADAEYFAEIKLQEFVKIRDQLRRAS